MLPLLFWYYNSDGSGYVRIKNLEGTPLFLKTFKNDFGSKITHHFTVGYELNINSLHKSDEPTIYPNPAKNKLYIDFNFSESYIRNGGVAQLVRAGES